MASALAWAPGGGLRAVGDEVGGSTWLASCACSLLFWPSSAWTWDLSPPEPTASRVDVLSLAWIPASAAGGEGGGLVSGLYFVRRSVTFAKKLRTRLPLRREMFTSGGP